MLPTERPTIKNMSLFAVVRTRGPAWQPSLPLESQLDWPAHARFMDALATEGFILLGGPLDGTPDVLLIFRAASSEEIVDRLEDDPWTASDMLRIIRVSPWTLRLGSLLAK